VSSRSRHRSLGWSRLVGAVGLAALSATACRQDMHNQAKVEPLEASRLFPDGAASRPLPPHTVAQGFLQEDRALHTGLEPSGGWVADLPVELDAELLNRGRERFEIYCAPCHDRTGGGRGMIVQRGFQQPPAYWEERLLGMPVGYFFDVATNGYGQMSGYAAQVPVHDRWAIAAWVRVLQRARTVSVAGLPEQERRWVEEGHSLAAPAAAPHGATDPPNSDGPDRSDASDESDGRGAAQGAAPGHDAAVAGDAP
jgi:mono/diheme cytochrome c family protein